MDLDYIKAAKKRWNWHYCVSEPVDGSYHWVNDWYCIPHVGHPVGGLPIYIVFCDKRYGLVMDCVRLFREWVWITT